MEDHQVVALIASKLLAANPSVGFESERAQVEVVNIAHEILQMAKKKVEQEGG